VEHFLRLAMAAAAGIPHHKYHRNALNDDRQFQFPYVIRNHKRDGLNLHVGPVPVKWRPDEVLDQAVMCADGWCETHKKVWELRRIVNTGAREYSGKIYNAYYTVDLDGNNYNKNPALALCLAVLQAMAGEEPERYAELNEWVKEAGL
jgi:hypothetical protein